MRICVLADKPSILDVVLPHLREMHPDMDSGAFAFAQVHPIYHLNPYFDLPRGLSWRDYPFSGGPRYRPFRFGYPGRGGGWESGLRFGSDEGVVVGEDGETVMDEDGSPWKRWGMEKVPGDPTTEALARYRSADVVYAVVDPNPSDWLALSRALEFLDLPARCEVRIPWINDLKDERVRAALAQPFGPGHVRYAEMLARGRIRRRFDYGYLANSLAVHGRTLRQAGAAPGAPVPSKYGIQTLYDLRARGAASEARLVWRMQEWTGTGKYRREDVYPWVGLGGPASRFTILETLARAGLTRVGDKRVHGLTDLGHRFLDLLHPDSEDQDLPFRIHAWTGMPEAEANAKVDRYVRTFFGKQVRFLSKRTAQDVN